MELRIHAGAELRCDHREVCVAHARAAVTSRQLLHAFLLLSVAFLISGTTGDPDLWGHVRFGQDMLALGSVRLPDTYSFTADRTWINHEWLAELLMAVAFDWFGAAGLNLLRIATIAGALILVWFACRDIGERRRVMLVAVCALGIFMRAHPIRPQIFSLLMFAGLLTVLKRSDDQRSLRPLVWVPVLMMAWVNLHGGWIVGLGFFAMWGAARAITNHEHRIPLACALGVTLAATLINPFGPGMWHFLAETVRLERPMIGDWQPLTSLPAPVWMSWLAGVGIIAIAARSSTRDQWVRVAMAASVGILAIRVSRLDAFFALASVFVAAAVLPKSEPAPMPSRQASGSPALAMLLALCLLPFGYVMSGRIAAVPVPSHMMPDSNVATYVRDAQLKGHVLTWFNWGEYSIWHFGPDLKVSMDGRRETVYSGDVVSAHLDFYFGTDQWRYADQINADYVWIPKQLPVARELQQHGWHRLCEGDSSILLARRAHARQCEQTRSAAIRLFPQL
jgi:hypothetical protein